jgi:Leucine-rich repeat (LRR) protein
LGFNQIGSLRGGIENMLTLTDLFISSNRIESLEELENLTRLYHLDASFNSIKYLTGLENLRELSTLDLKSNNIESILPKTPKPRIL